MARGKGNKVLKRYARAKSVFGVKTGSSHAEYIKVRRAVSVQFLEIWKKQKLL